MEELTNLQEEDSQRLTCLMHINGYNYAALSKKRFMKINKYLKYKAIYVVNKLGLLNSISDPFILMYHRVIEDPINYVIPVQPGMYVTKNTFQMQIEYLKYYYDVLPLNVLLESYFSGKKMKHCCSITFDDGWNDNYSNVYEILKFYKIPASFFLATSFIGTSSRFWSEDVAWFLHNNDQTSINYLFSRCNVPSDLKNIIINNKLLLSNKITETVRQMKYIDNKLRNQIIDNIKKYNDKFINFGKTMMDWDQVNEMYRSGLCKFYPHSHSHELLTEMNENEISEEISTSIRMINQRIDYETNIDIFCYPSGKTNDKVINILKIYGIKYALGTINGKLNIKYGHYKINRIRIHDDISNNVHMFKYLLI